MHLRINRAWSYKCVTNLPWTKSIYYDNNVHNIYKTIKQSLSFYFFHSGYVNILSFATMSWITQINFDSWKEKKSSTYGFSKEQVLKHISSPKNFPSRQVWFSKIVARNCCCDGRGYRLVGITTKEDVRGNFE